MTEAPGHDRTLVVVNPASAGGRTRGEWPAVQAALADAGVDHDERFSRGPGEATDITREALRSGYRRVVAVGGDGTLNEVLNGFFDELGPVRADAVLGMVPSGTGGDFRKTAGIPFGHAAAAALLARGDERRIDVGRIRYLEDPPDGLRHFVNIADCGLGGEVVARANAGAKRLGGTLTFYVASVQAIVAFGRRRCRVEVDGAPIEGRMQNVVVANGRCFGGGMQVAPRARLDDGLLDIVILGDIPRIRALLDSRSIYRGEHIGKPGIVALRGREVRITPLDRVPFRFDVDGELVGRAPALVDLLPSAIGLCAPRQG